MDSLAKSEEPSKKNPWFHQVLLERQLNAHNEFKQPTLADSNTLAFALKEDLETLLQLHNLPCSLKLAIQALEPKEKAVLILRFQQNYSPQKIADVLGLSKEALLSLFQRLNIKLHQPGRSTSSPP